MESGAVQSRSVLFGSTFIAMIVTVVVMAVVSMVVGGLVTLVHYFMSSMRIEAAGFFGAIFGGIAGVYASRMSCDAIFKSYHRPSIFVLFAVLIAAGVYVELIALPWEWSRVTPIAQMIAVGVTAWMIFWNEEAI